MLQFSSIVLSNKEIAPRYFQMILQAPETNYLPGQFIMIKVNSSYTPLLRRAMAILSWKERKLEIIYKAIGLGTKELAKHNEGDSVEILGPLGNSYEIPKNLKTAYLVTGGVGMVPLYPLAEELIKRKIKTILYFGGGTSTDLVMRHEFSNLGVEVKATTMDGSLGNSGLVTDVMEENLNRRTIDPTTEMIYTCGPHIMMHKVTEIGNKFKLQTQISVETRMACGTGVCLGCVVKVESNNQFSYIRACTEGPVFYGKEIDWHARLD